MEEMQRKLSILRKACEAEDDELARLALMEVVPTFHRAEEVNAEAEDAEEMREQSEMITA